MVSILTVMVLVVIFLTLPVCLYFTRKQRANRVSLADFRQKFFQNHYYLHVLAYLVIAFWKGWIDSLNEPMKRITGHWTDLVFAIEGNASLWFQELFMNQFLTDVLNFHYLFIYLFLIYVTTVYFAYANDRDMADKVTLNYLLIYCIAVPYYLFFNVEVTSSWIPGMEALLYHDPVYLDFYVTHDPLDNAVPSLHIAIPFGILLLGWLDGKERGISLRESRHYGYMLFIFANTLIFMFAIIYLGIHWWIDIPLGLAVGAIGALFIHQIQPRLRGKYGGITWPKEPLRLIAVPILIAGLLSAAMLATVQASTVDTTMRIAEGDMVYEIIQPFSEGESASTLITNFDNSASVQFVVIELEQAPGIMADGKPDWGLIHNNPIVLVNPGQSVLYPHEKADTWQLIMVESLGGSSVEVGMVTDYGDARMLEGWIASMPSLLITGFVLQRLWRQKSSSVSLADTRSLPLEEEE
jgi:hypothetical protein